MKKYLHNPDHRICGNFNNIDYDYPYHIYGEVTYDTPLVNAMIARLDAGEDSEQANEDRDFLVDWFFETFWNMGEYPIISSQIYQSSFIWSLKTNNLKSMKTITLQLYTFDELSEEVQKEIIERERWNIMDQCMEAYGSDYVTSLRTFEKLTNTQSCSWSVNYSGYNF